MSAANPGPTTVSPLKTYFTAFHCASFTYQPARTAHENFNRLCASRGWDRESPEWEDAREDFHDAIVQEFNFIYGTDRNDLGCWHKLCKAIGIEPLPDTVEVCRSLVWDSHVNIIDLIDTFASLDELRKYTKNTDRFFPKKNAYRGDLLKDLLRELIYPYHGRRRNGSAKRKNRRARRRAAAAATSRAN